MLPICNRLSSRPSTLSRSRALSRAHLSKSLQVIIFKLGVRIEE
jgi:hypothetical protein